MTLLEFMLNNKIKNSEIKHPKFNRLYLRKSKRLMKIEKTILHPEFVIEIATIEAKFPGNGDFASLIEWFYLIYPECTIYIENVLTERFANHLIKNGFVPDKIYEDCYVYNWEQYF